MDTSAIADHELRPVRRIGEGAYACVLLASLSKKDIASNNYTTYESQEAESLCAVKIFKSKSKEVVRLAKREVEVHVRLNGHPNIVHLRGAYRTGGGRPIFLMEYYPRDLQSELRQHAEGLPKATLKLLSWQLLQAFRFMHSQRFLHRDLKPTNVLLSADGVLKVGDFGLARAAPAGEPRIGGPEQQLTNYVFTRWYRAPEVLLNKQYGTAADIWSIGCTVAEMASGSPLLPGKSSVDQIFEIWRMFGSLPRDRSSANTAPDTGAGTGSNTCGGGGGEADNTGRDSTARAAMNRSSLRTRLGALVEEPLLELLEAALRTEPSERATAEDLLRMSYFHDVPELVAGTALEELYEWNTDDDAAASARAAAVRAGRLQAAELDLPQPVARAEHVAVAALPQPLPLPQPVPSPDQVNVTEMVDVATSAVGSDLVALPQGDDVAATAREQWSGAAATGAATERSGAAPDAQEEEVGAHNQVEGGPDMTLTGPRDGGSTGALPLTPDPRDISLLVHTQAARADSVPFLDAHEIHQQAHRSLCRTSSAVTERRAQGPRAAGGGAGGETAAAAATRDARVWAGSGGGRQRRAGAAGRMATTSLRRFFARQQSSSLSAWSGLQSDMVTMVGNDSVTNKMQSADPRVSAAAHAWTASVIPEDPPAAVEPQPPSAPSTELAVKGLLSESLPMSATAEPQAVKENGERCWEQLPWQQQQVDQKRNQNADPPAAASSRTAYPLSAVDESAAAAVRGGAVVQVCTTVSNILTSAVASSNTRLTEFLAQAPRISAAGHHTVGGDKGSAGGPIPRVGTAAPANFSGVEHSTSGHRAFVLKILSFIAGDTAAGAASPRSGSGIAKEQRCLPPPLPLEMQTAIESYPTAASPALPSGCVVAGDARDSGGSAAADASIPVNQRCQSGISPGFRPEAAVTGSASLVAADQHALVMTSATRSGVGKRTSPCEYDDAPRMYDTSVEARLAGLDAWNWPTAACTACPVSQSQSLKCPMPAADKEKAAAYAGVFADVDATEVQGHLRPRGVLRRLRRLVLCGASANY